VRLRIVAVPDWGRHGLYIRIGVCHQTVVLHHRGIIGVRTPAPEYARNKRKKTGRTPRAAMLNSWLSRTGSRIGGYAADATPLATIEISHSRVDVWQRVLAAGLAAYAANLNAAKAFGTSATAVSVAVGVLMIAGLVRIGIGGPR
jgi:hypothetical protein